MADELLRAKIGERLRSLRRDAGLTQEEIADYGGVHVNAVSLAERGVTNVTVDALKKMLTPLKLSVSDFLDSIDE